MLIGNGLVIIFTIKNIRKQADAEAYKLQLLKDISEAKEQEAPLKQQKPIGKAKKGGRKK